MDKFTAFEKAEKVITSCNSIIQYSVCKNYIDNYSRIYNDLDKTYELNLILKKYFTNFS